MTDSRRFGTFAAALALLLLFSRGDIAGQASAARTGDPPDREYRLESSMLGYRGIGGEIDGIRNPTLWARTGETVRITIVNGELMVHDIALDKGEVKSTQILDKGATANITFKATASRHLFLFAARAPRRGHGGPARSLRLAAVVRRDEARSRRPRLESRFRIGNARQLDRDRRRVRSGQGRWPAGGGRRQDQRHPRSVGQLLGEQRREGQRPERHAGVGALPGDPAVRQLPGIGRRIQEHARRAGAGRRSESHLHDQRHRQRPPAPGGRRSAPLRRQEHLHPRRR